MEEVVQAPTIAEKLTAIYKQKNLEATIQAVEEVFLPELKAKAAATATPIDDVLVNLVEQELKKFLTAVVK